MSRPWMYRLRSQLRFANVVSMLALFVALGGSAYASGVLGPNTVGRIQLQPDSVTSGKLAPASVGTTELRPHSVTMGALAFGSVGLGTLTPKLRAHLKQLWSGDANAAEASHAAQQPGPAGPAGPVGPRGVTGPGAVRVHYLASASSTPSPQTAIALNGLSIEAQCESTLAGIQLNLAASAQNGGQVIESISEDGGPGSPSIAAAQSANLQIELPAGRTVLGGPSAANGEYTRIIAHLIYVAAASTDELTLALMLDADAGTCAIDGVGVSAGGAG